MSYLEQASGSASQDRSKFTAEDFATAKSFLNDYIAGEKSEEDLISAVNERLSPGQAEPYRYSEYRKY